MNDQGMRLKYSISTYQTRNLKIEVIVIQQLLVKPLKWRSEERTRNNAKDRTNGIPLIINYVAKLVDLTVGEQCAS